MANPFASNYNGLNTTINGLNTINTPNPGQNLNSTTSTQPEWLPLSSLARSSNNQRQVIDQNKVATLVNLIRQGTYIRPIEVVPENGPGGTTYGVIDGLHRWSAYNLMGASHIAAIVHNYDQTQATLASFQANEGTANTLADKVATCYRLYQLGNPASRIKEQTEISAADNYIKFKYYLSPTGLEHFINERLPMNAALELIRLPREIQDVVLGLAVAQLTASGRKIKLSLAGIQEVMRLNGIVPGVAPGLPQRGTVSDLGNNGRLNYSGDAGITTSANTVTKPVVKRGRPRNSAATNSTTMDSLNSRLLQVVTDLVAVTKEGHYNPSDVLQMVRERLS